MADITHGLLEACFRLIHIKTSSIRVYIYNFNAWPYCKRHCVIWKKDHTNGVKFGRLLWC